MKTIQIISILFILSLYGCPYKSQVPISEPAIQVDKTLLGKWNTSENWDKDTFLLEQSSYMEITALDEFRYAISDIQFSTSDSTVNTKEYVAFFSKIDERTFLNITENETPPFMIYLMERTSPSAFTLIEVTDNIDEKFEVSDDLRAFLKENAHLSFLYENEEVDYQKIRE